MRVFQLEFGCGPEKLVGSVLCSLSCLVQCCGFNPLMRIFLVEEDFSHRVNIRSDSNKKKKKKTLSDESKNRGLVCAHMHFIAWADKILTFMS